jgi:arsenate reductase-like glutaredoxin family protein
VSCGRAQEFLAKTGATIAEQVDAKKKVLKLADAMSLLKGADHLYAAKGKKVVHFDLKKDKPSEADLAAVLLGPTGNLRAPALKKGRTVLIGFDEATYRAVFG